MLEVRYSTKFKKDFKACEKRRCKMGKLQQVIDTLPAAIYPFTFFRASGLFEITISTI